MSAIASQDTQQHQVMPETVSGKCSVVSFGVFLLGLIALLSAAAAGQKGGETILDNLWLGIPALVTFAGATTSMISGLVAVLRRRERLLSVVFATAVSTFVFLWALLELLFG